MGAVYSYVAKSAKEWYNRPMETKPYDISPIRDGWFRRDAMCRDIWTRFQLDKVSKDTVRFLHRGEYPVFIPKDCVFLQYSTCAKLLRTSPAMIKRKIAKMLITGRFKVEAFQAEGGEWEWTKYSIVSFMEPEPLPVRIKKAPTRQMVLEAEASYAKLWA